MKKLLILLFIFVSVTNVFAENWVKYNQGGSYIDGSYIDGDSIMMLENPKRVIFDTKHNLVGYNDRYLLITTGILCNSGKRYTISSHETDGKQILAIEMESKLNIETDMIPGSFDVTIYRSKCLKKK